MSENNRTNTWSVNNNIESPDNEHEFVNARDQPTVETPAGLGSNDGENFSNNGNSLRGEPMDIDVGSLVNGMQCLDIQKAQFKPPSQPPFTGAKRDALAVDNWLDYIEDLHMLYNAKTDVAKVFMCKFHLQDEALRWYRRNDMRSKSWDEFKAKFKQRFHPPHMYEDEYIRFMNLKQLGSIVSYNNEFNRSLDIISDYVSLPESALKQQYCKGLRPDVALLIRPVLPMYPTLEGLQLATYETVIAQKELEKAQGKSRPQPQKKNVNNINVNQEKSKRTNVLTKQQCRREGRCFRCKEKGHMFMNCPQQDKSESQHLNENRQ